MNRTLAVVAVLTVMSLAVLTGCSGRSGAGGSSASAALGSATGTAAGLRWSVPADWTVLGEKPMRVASYGIPARGGGEGGECAVFHFGHGQGGDKDANIVRWIDQFEPGAKSERSSSVVNGLTVARVRVDGTYLAPSGPMMESQGSKSGYRLIGAIVEGPEGLVFFKATGPARTIEGASAAFDAMLGSLKKP